MTSCGKVWFPESLGHLAAALVEREAMGQHDVEGRAAARAAAFEKGGARTAQCVDLRDTSPYPDRPRRRDGCRPVRENARRLRGRRRGCSRNRTRLRPGHRSCRNRRHGALRPGTAPSRPWRTRRRRLPFHRPRRCGRSLPRREGYSCPPLRTKIDNGTPQARWRDSTPVGFVRDHALDCDSRRSSAPERVLRRWHVTLNSVGYPSLQDTRSPPV